jgi:hypothetical protein
MLAIFATVSNELFPGERARSIPPLVEPVDVQEDASKSYVSRILRLALLAPDIVEAIVAGKTDQSLMLERLERPLPASWDEQRRLVQAGSM